MSTWTVISILDPYGAPDHIGAVPGHVSAYGHNVHTATVPATTADEAIGKVREAFRIIGASHITAPDEIPPLADRWTVVGLGGNGVCASFGAVAVIVGEHEMEGQRDSFLSRRWVRVVDAANARAAESAGCDAMNPLYNATWD